MKKWLLAAGLGSALTTSTRAANKIAIVNMGSPLQQVVQKTSVSNTLENEFKSRTSELRRTETDPQTKMKKPQFMKVGSDCTKLEEDVMVWHQTFIQKAQVFEQDHVRHSNGERGKLVTRIQAAVKSVASSQDTDLVVNTSAVTYNGSDVKNTTVGVLKQAKQTMPSIRLVDLAQQLDAELHGDDGTVVTGVTSVQFTQTGHATFMVNLRYREHLGLCQVSAVVMTQDGLSFMKNAALVAKNPYLIYARMAQILDTTPQPTQDIAPSAVINATAELGNNVSIDANAMIESGVELGDNVIVGAGCFVGKNNKIGAGSRLWTSVIIYHEIQTGQSCLAQSRTVVGVDDFGYVGDHDNWVKIPQIDRAVIGGRVEIGACTAIDCGALDGTIIGNDVIIDNQCQIVHNAVTGDNTAVAGGVIMVGSLKIGRYCMIGGVSVINGHMEICNRVAITGMSMVMRPTTEPGVYSSGIPLQSDKVWRKTAALVMDIDDMSKCLKSLERRANQQD